jgi:hypothetical protein
MVLSKKLFENVKEKGSMKIPLCVKQVSDDVS